MKNKIMATATLVALLMSLSLVAGATGTEHCPDHESNPKVETGNLNGIVLDAGTSFCVKGSTDATGILTANGTTTLFEYLGSDHDVSYYVIYETSPPSTTTTTVSETTTTTVVNTTTTTQPEVTTTTVPETTTTTLPYDSIPETTTTVTVVEEITHTTLPFTGPTTNLGLVALAGLALIAVGTVLRHVKD